MLKALIVNLVSTFVGTRSPAALADSGFETALAAYPNSFFLQSDRLTKRFRLRVGHDSRVEQVGRDLAEVIRQWKPDLIVPQDATAHQVLNYLGMQAASAVACPEVIMRVKRSLGDNRPVALRSLRAMVQGSLTAVGLPILPARGVTCLMDIVEFANDEGWPVILKREGSQNGEGVAICANRLQAEAVLVSWNVTSANPIMVQKYLNGPVTRHSLSALDGRVLAEVTGVQIHGRRDDPRQAPTVVRLASTPAVSAIAERLVGHWRLTGFSGFDFLCDPVSGQYYLIDFNPRINSLSHLGFLVGRDLSAALYDGLSGQSGRSSALITPALPDTYATVFPFEWQRDPRSPYLSQCASDTPWDDPPLLKAVLNRFRVSSHLHEEHAAKDQHLLFNYKA